MRVEPRGVARVLASAAVSAAVVALLSAPAAGPGALRLGSSAGTSVATLTYGDFLELDGIKKFLGDEGLANASSYDELSDLADGYTVIKKYDAATGRELAEFAEHRVEDPNHVQLIEEDSLAFVSSRSTNGIVKEDAATGDVVWVLGGEHGKFDIVDERGHNHTAGSNYFLGQHNAEYFGDDEYCLFDNQKGSAKSSRLLCLRLNEAEGVATFEVRVIEVENDGDVAMEIKVAGDLCRNATGCYRDDYGWTSYSAGGFTTPLVYETACGLHAVSFKTVSNFKQNDLANGTYAVRVNGDERKSGAFSFKPHWRPQGVTVDGAGTLAANDVVILRVANAPRGDETSTTLDCAPGA
ncbi:hypothetical protein SO694_00044156 [Aureococcus anophagefferens]|uniref:Uncharacterized protein n=1 Tax=Aureococcus anophagefferens TaxID=44056 RepID=A0ABR1G7X0_AURAN